ncbi:hypothetical protein ACIA8G_00940 [Lentzea sp. NPDC051213]|uniref:hypothetical protein n=1 Tax=Lentzea sp. NPDC051213 TaxID=3364126 RepID=UPI0037AAF115
MNTIWPAIIAALAALLGATLGALVEPLKLSAARRARIRQERLERSAELIEVANEARGLAIAVNRRHRGEQIGGGQDDWTEIAERHHAARAKLRTITGVLRILGPDALADAAQRVHSADAELSVARFEEAPAPDDGRPLSIPPRILALRDALDTALTDFTDVARKHVR